MLDLTLNKPEINPDRLHADLKLALGETFLGASFARGVLTLHLDAHATPAQQAQALTLAAAHDPAVLTPAQDAARARKESPFFSLSRDALEVEAAKLDAATFQREMVRAFAYLRDLVIGG